MTELFQAFVLGNGAILTNACILPLYPGMIAFLSGGSSSTSKTGISGWLGVLVLAGILSMMVAIAFGLFLLNAAFGDVFPVVLPVIYVVVIGLGILMLFGFNPFNRLQTLQSPVVSSPFTSAYLYGLLLGPMTLPCTGPILSTAFLLSVDPDGTLSIQQLAGELLYFLSFGLGFGWPLLLLPLLAAPIQRRFLKWITRRHEALNRVSGVVLIGIGIYGIWTELIPNWTLLS